VKRGLFGTAGGPELERRLAVPPPSRVLMIGERALESGYSSDCTSNRIEMASQVTSVLFLLRPESNQRFERSRDSVFVKPRRESLFGINQLRWSATKPRVAQPHRYATSSPAMLAP